MSRGEAHEICGSLRQFGYNGLKMKQAPEAHIPDYDSVELRGGRLYKLSRSEARVLGDADGMALVAKCYCRSIDIHTAADAEQQRRPGFVFPIEHFPNLESLIGKELQGRVFSDSRGRRVKFQLDLTEHAGFQIDREDRTLHSPWYDDSVLKD
jgi:hypothetical protein